MSRRIIHNVVIPILQKMLDDMKILPRQQGLHHNILEDENLETFLEVKLAGYLGVIRKKDEGHCLSLEQAINEAILKDEAGFKELLKKLLADYVKLYLDNNPEELEKLQKEVDEVLKKLKDSGPPDKLREARRKFAEIWSRV